MMNCIITKNIVFPTERICLFIAMKICSSISCVFKFKSKHDCKNSIISNRFSTICKLTLCSNNFFYCISKISTFDPVQHNIRNIHFRIKITLISFCFYNTTDEINFIFCKIIPSAPYSLARSKRNCLRPTMAWGPMVRGHWLWYR